jgi:uncharacterized repeat protein (TIGR01451 family)
MARWKLYLLLPLSWVSFSLPAAAEGSRNLYPSTSPSTAFRANTEWRNDFYGSIVKRRTLFKVYAQQGEYILMGSSAVGITGSNGQKGDIWVYKPNTVTGSIGDESIPSTPDFKCTSQSGTGFISSRTQELAGPRTIDPVTLPSTYGNSTGYIPCYYQAPETGIYDVVVMGPLGFNTTFDGTPTGNLDIGTSASKPNNFNANQNSSIAAWDITVRNSKTSTSDITGRLFTYYLALFTAGNGRPIYSTIYPVTIDGYQYKTDIRGLDPNGFVLYGNEVGFFDSNGTSTLYHNVVGNNGQLETRDGGTSLSRPQFPIFFNTPDTSAFPYINLYDRNGAFADTGLPITPIIPIITDVSFLGTLGQNDTELAKGGNFRFRTSTKGRYQIIIKGNGSSDFEALNPLNRFIQGNFSSPGTYSIPWDGKDNAGNDFPVANGYQFQIRVVGGEYHFPMLDAENNYYGGPTITLLNPPTAYPSDPPSYGTTTAFYDDRVYKTIGGTIVHVGATQTNIDNNDPICGVGAPTIRYSDPVKGFDSTTNQRTFGQASGGNSNSRCSATGSFGDTKGLDLWTFFPRGYQSNSLNILNTTPTKMLLVKRITSINNNTIARANGQDMSLFNDDSETNNQDNFTLWPDSDANRDNNTNIYLRGAINGGKVEKNDEIEYTIYYLIINNQATNVKICDLVPQNTTFLPDAFGGSQGIALASNNTSLPTAPNNFFTNSNSDSDRGGYYPPGTAPTGGCKKPDPNNPSSFVDITASDNTNGLVVVNVVTSPTFLPKANTAGNPTDSYGFIRFRAKVNP